MGVRREEVQTGISGAGLGAAGKKKWRGECHEGLLRQLLTSLVFLQKLNEPVPDMLPGTVYSGKAET